VLNLKSAVQLSRKKDIHRVVVEVDEPNLLKRAQQLHMLAYKEIQGTKLLRFLRSDYENGVFEFLIEADNVTPPPVPINARVSIEKYDGPVASAAQM